MGSQTKDRIIDATSELFRRQGYTGTGLKQIVAQANAPFGSIYHFFPGGKEELGETVIRVGGEMYFRIFEGFMDAAPDVVTGISNFFEGAAVLLPATDYADACPIATIALEVANTNELLRQATADVFESWIAGAAARFVAAGIEMAKGVNSPFLIICGLEGAFVLSRAMRTPEPIRIAGANASAAVAAALAARPESAA